MDTESRVLYEWIPGYEVKKRIILFAIIRGIIAGLLLNAVWIYEKFSSGNAQVLSVIMCNVVVLLAIFMLVINIIVRFKHLKVMRCALTESNLEGVLFPFKDRNKTVQPYKFSIPIENIEAVQVRFGLLFITVSTQTIVLYDYENLRTIAAAITNAMDISKNTD